MHNRRHDSFPAESCGLAVFETDIHAELRTRYHPGHSRISPDSLIPLSDNLIFPADYQHIAMCGLIRALLRGKAACACSPYNRPNPVAFDKVERDTLGRL